jgi:hypothetical protein
MLKDGLPGKLVMKKLNPGAKRILHDNNLLKNKSAVQSQEFKNCGPVVTLYVSSVLTVSEAVPGLFKRPFLR